MPRRLPPFGSPISPSRINDETNPASAQAWEAPEIEPEAQEDDTRLLAPTQWTRPGALPLRTRAPWAPDFAAAPERTPGTSAGGSLNVPHMLRAKYLPNFESLPLRVLTCEERAEAMCCISHDRLCATEQPLQQPIACRINGALHVFEWQALFNWIGSPNYRCDNPKHTFINPLNRCKTNYSDLFRIEPERQISSDDDAT